MFLFISKLTAVGIQLFTLPSAGILCRDGRYRFRIGNPLSVGGHLHKVHGRITVDAVGNAVGLFAVHKSNFKRCRVDGDLRIVVVTLVG